MKELHVVRRRMDMAAFRNRAAAPGDFTHIVEPGTLVRDRETGELLIAHIDLAERFPKDLLSAVQRLRYDTSTRTSGLKTTSRVFGFQPRIAMRRDFCTATTTSREHPREHDVLCFWAAKLSEEYRQLNPGRFRRQTEAVGRVRQDWMIPGSVFTSGIVNWNNQLAYHRDQGNFSDLWSFMVVLARDIDGGMLSVPELDLALRYTGAVYSAFDGASLIHGVTPIRKRSVAAYRYSIVWYALQGMCNCGSPAEELERIKRVKTQREEKRRAR